MFTRAATRSFKPPFFQPTKASSPRFAAKAFSTSLPNMVKVGDPLPDVDLAEGSPGNKVNLHKSLTGKGLVIGVPAAFSPSCSDTHIPGYVNSAKTKSAGNVYVVSVNDAFVMKAWQKTLDEANQSGIHFLADATGDFTNALDLGFDASALLGNRRSKRYALLIEDGKVKSVHVEAAPSDVKESAVDKVLGT